LCHLAQIPHKMIFHRDIQRLLLLFFLVFFCQITFCSATESEHKTASKEAGSGTAQAGENKRISKLVCQAQACHLQNNDPAMADSLLRIAISLAEMTYKNELILQAYNDYIECMDMGQFDKTRLTYAMKAMQISNSCKDNRLLWRTYHNIAEVYQAMYLYDKALDFSYKSYNIADYLRNDTLRARSYLSIGNSLRKNNNFVEAFRNYLQALNIAEVLKDYTLLDQCYKVLSKFYNLSKNYDKAIEFKLKQGALIRNQTEIDSLKLMYNQFELEEINFNSHRTANETSLELIISYAMKHQEERLKYFVFSLYRSYLINNDKFGKLRALYLDRFPAELTRLLSQDSSMYFRVRALIAEDQHLYDSAYYYFGKAAQLIDQNSNKELKATFYLRYGQYLVRRENQSQAIVMFTKAFQYANEGHNLEFAIKASSQLQAVYESLKDYQQAFYFAKRTLALSDSLELITKKDDLLLMDIDNATTQREEALQRQARETQRNHNIQYTAIIILMIVIFIILILLGSLHVPRWVIEFLGFISFIFLFEFIVLIADHKIEEITHGEPWKVLAIKIVLIGILMPLHHLVERRMIAYLLNKKLLHFSKDSFRRFFREMFRPEHHKES